MENKKISVIIPTYNEADCIVPLINEILKIHLPLNIIVVDDNSPDKTGKIVEEKFKNNPYVHVFIRKGKRGRGLAGIFGYKKAIEIGSDIIGEMDGDFSHHPSYIPEMVKNINGWDVVVFSAAESLIYAGLFGIAASEYVKKTRKPIVLIRDEGRKIVVTIRSSEGRALELCKELSKHIPDISYGGHREAASITIYGMNLNDVVDKISVVLSTMSR